MSLGRQQREEELNERLRYDGMGGGIEEERKRARRKGGGRRRQWREDFCDKKEER